MPNLRGSEWLILLLLVVLLFGARRLPEAARGLGRSLRIFKAETKGLTEPEPTAEQTDAATAAAPELPSAPAAPSTTPTQPHQQSPTQQP